MRFFNVILVPTVMFIIFAAIVTDIHAYEVFEFENAKRNGLTMKKDVYNPYGSEYFHFDTLAGIGLGKRSVDSQIRAENAGKKPARQFFLPGIGGGLNMRAARYRTTNRNQQNAPWMR
uniref:Secreted protein n=1 Tax=Panagrolaimus sp. JU765 TaxID=591449 RepID=A0AC34QI67_9BILA